MSSHNIVLSGTFYWSRPHEGQEDEYEDKKFYKVTLVPDDASWAKFARTGLKLKKKSVNGKDPDAPEGLTFKRDMLGKEIEDSKTHKMKVLGGGPIPVVDSDGNTIKDEIGNGSKGDLLIAVYTGKYKGRAYTGHRTEKMRVTKLVKYDPWDDSESDFDHAESDDDQDDTTVSSSQEVKKTKNRLDDDLPF